MRGKRENFKSLRASWYLVSIKPEDSRRLMKNVPENFSHEYEARLPKTIIASRVFLSEIPFRNAAHHTAENMHLTPVLPQHDSARDYCLSRMPKANAVVRARAPAHSSLPISLRFLIRSPVTFTRVRIKKTQPLCQTLT